MKKLKRILCIILCVVILSMTVGTKYFDSNHMEKVEAGSLVVAAAGISAATIAEICLFVGTTALAAYGIYEGYENREEIARFGKEFIDSCSSTAEGWVMQIVDTSGQDYVFGSEALQLVRDTEWSVIQGGLPPEGDPNKKDDKDKDKFHIPGDPMTHVAQFTALGATWFTTNAQNIYQDWCDILDGWIGKDTPIPQNNVLANNFPQSVSDADVAAQWSGSYFNYNASVIMENNLKNAKGDPWINKTVYNLSGTRNYPIAASLVENYYPDLNAYTIGFQIWSKSTGVVTLHSLDYTKYNYSKGELKSTYSSKTNTISNQGTITAKSDTSYDIASLSASVNFPVFTSIEAAQNYLNTGEGYENSLNYGNSYRIADWLQQDWAGQLIDPLVNIGLTLSQLVDLMKALGLKTVQGLNAQQLLELLEDALPKLDPALLPGATPTPIVVDPAVDPIYYPDPDAHPDKPPRPVIDPDPASGLTPGTDPDPDPDPDPGVTPLPDMDVADYKVDLKIIFPFCIPFDFVALLKALDAEPRAPCFTFPVVIPALEYRENVKLDMSIFDDVAQVMRMCEKVSFLIFLMLVTSKVIRW